MQQDQNHLSPTPVSDRFHEERSHGEEPQYQDRIAPFLTGRYFPESIEWPRGAAMVRELSVLGERLDLLKKAYAYGGGRTYGTTTGANTSMLAHAPARTHDLLHAAIGSVTESIEFLEAIWRYATEGKRLDRTNAVEELGDMEWYMALARRALGVTQQAVQEGNIRKLTARYGERFSSRAAYDRDTEAEMKALEHADEAEQLSLFERAA